ncbi:MAG TPA: xylulokinase [Levilinea sp.]|nr:xylulokinase [Levilinea sp.]
MAFLLGLDIGTSGAKALLSDEKGHVLASAVAEYPLSTPQPLWSEQNPADWWRGAKEALALVLKGVSSGKVAGLGLTGQMHGSVFLDASDRIIRPALLWNDQRTAEECRQITGIIGQQRLIEIAGNPALTGFQAPKILWLRNHEPQNYARLERVLLPKDYIRLLLTGEAATDVSDAAGTLLLDLARRDYSSEILEKLAFERSWLPKVYEGPEVTGRLLADVAAELGLPFGLPVVAGGGDNAAAAVGTGVVHTGIVSSSIGTSGVIFAHSDEIAYDPMGRLHTFCHAVPGKYHLMAVTLSAGGSFRWWRDVLRAASGRDLSYEQMTGAAASVPAGAEGLLFLPYLTGERTPHLDPYARGVLVGLTARHSAAHIARAVMEGVVFSMKDGLEIMRSLGLPIGQIRATGGGGRSPLWRQMQADIYGAEVVTLRAEEGPAYGAALLAGVGAGIFASVDEATRDTVVVTSATSPAAAAQDRYEKVYGLYASLYSQMRSAMHALNELG